MTPSGEHPERVVSIANWWVARMNWCWGTSPHGTFVIQLEDDYAARAGKGRTLESVTKVGDEIVRQLGLFAVEPSPPGVLAHYGIHAEPVMRESQWVERCWNLLNLLPEELQAVLLEEPTVCPPVSDNDQIHYSPVTVQHRWATLGWIHPRWSAIRAAMDALSGRNLYCNGADTASSKQLQFVLSRMWGRMSPPLNITQPIIHFHDRKTGRTEPIHTQHWERLPVFLSDVADAGRTPLELILFMSRKCFQPVFWIKSRYEAWNAIGRDPMLLPDSAHPAPVIMSDEWTAFLRKGTLPKE